MLSRVQAPPILVAQNRTADRPASTQPPLIDLSQAAPTGPPAPALSEHLAQLLASDPDIHRYGAILGTDELREEVARRWSDIYGGEINASEVAVTAGCNQAFCAAIASLIESGDEVILPTPWYFNHKMWLDMAGVTTVPLPADATNQFIPSPALAGDLLTPRTRAIVLVCPNNPTGVEYPAEVMQQFYELARSAGIVLVIDETYREFRFAAAPPHNLFAEHDWREHLCHLYSFSKVYRIPGHRVGTIVAGVPRLDQVQKFLDTVTICPPRLGQAAALFGLRELGDWVGAERTEIRRRAEHLRTVFVDRPGGFQLEAMGAYFAYVRHPFSAAGPEVAQMLIDRVGLIALEDSLFLPDPPSAGEPSHHLRLAFANVTSEELTAVGDRLRLLTT